MTFVVMQQQNGARNFNERISNFLTGEIVRKFILTRCTIYLGDYYQNTKNFLYFPWFFSNVQNMSNVWKLNGKQTFFQKCFNECTSFNRLRFLLYAFKGCFRANFLQFTGYPINKTRRPNMISDEEVQKEFDANFLINADIDESYPCRLKITLRFIEILNTIELLETPDEEQRNFFLNCFTNILNLLIKYSFIADKVFTIFKTLFGERKQEIVEKIKIDLMKFYSNCRSDKILKFSLQIDNFWRKLEDFLSFDVELLREILLSKYETNHPLIHAVLFDIESVSNCYKKHCTSEEIEKILLENNQFSIKVTEDKHLIYHRPNLIKKYFEQCNTMEKFYLKKLLLNCNENNQTMLGLLKQKLERKELSEIQEIEYKKILYLCTEFLNEFLTTSQIQKLFDLNSIFIIKTVLNEQELFILTSLDDIYKKANWNDILQMLLLNDYDDMDDTPYFKTSHEGLSTIVENKN